MKLRLQIKTKALRLGWDSQPQPKDQGFDYSPGTTNKPERLDRMREEMIRVHQEVIGDGPVWELGAG